MICRCPKCGGVVYNRRLNLCGYCGTELPLELLFSPADIERMDRNQAELAVEHQKQAAKLEAEELERQSAAKLKQAFMAGYFIGRNS